MIDKPLGKDIDIDSGFGALDTGYGKGLAFGGKDNASDDDDEDTGVVKCQKAFLEYGFKIEGIYTCRTTDEYSYLGIIAKD